MTFKLICDLREVVRQSFKIYLAAERGPSEMVVALIAIAQFVPLCGTTRASFTEDSLHQGVIVAGKHLIFINLISHLFPPLGLAADVLISK